MPKCSVEGCDRTAVARGWCSKHWKRWRKYGDPVAPGVKEFNRSMGFNYKGTPEHNSWAGMKARCLNPKSVCYSNYGGRGITICDRWLGTYGFQHFLEDMGPKPEPKSEYSLDRIDTNGGYCKENCRWANRKTQNGNRRMDIYLTFNGETHHIADWSRITGISDIALRQRYHNGWSIEKILTTPLQDAKARKKYSTTPGVSYNITTKKWFAEVVVGKVHHRKYCDAEEEAIRLLEQLKTIYPS